MYVHKRLLNVQNCPLLYQRYSTITNCKKKIHILVLFDGKVWTCASNSTHPRRCHTSTTSRPICLIGRPYCTRLIWNTKIQIQSAVLESAKSGLSVDTHRPLIFDKKYFTQTVEGPLPIGSQRQYQYLSYGLEPFAR